MGWKRQPRQPRRFRDLLLPPHHRCHNAQKEDGASFVITKVSDVSSDVESVLISIKNGETIRSDVLSEGIKESISRTLIQVKIVKAFETVINPDQISHIEKLLEEDVTGLVNLTTEMLADGTWRGQVFRPYNVELIPPQVNYGKKHPYAEFNDWLKEILVGLGFTEWHGPYVETEFWAFDSLFVPQDHVSRDSWDSFVITKPHRSGSIIDSKYYREVSRVHENGGDTGSKAKTLCSFSTID